MIRRGIALIVMLLFVITSGTISIKNHLTESHTIDVDNSAYSHIILAEFGTFTTCIYCKYAHEALRYLYYNRGDDYPFYYVTHVYDVNKHAYQRVKTELNLTASPTVFWDGGYTKDVGAPDNETAVGKYKKSVNTMVNRTVADIDLFVKATWLGAVNNKPYNGETKVLINQTLKWTNTEMIVNVLVFNNESSQYKGHLHVYVCDIKSSMGWYDTADKLYTMAFLDYAFNQNITLDGKSLWGSSINWDGLDHTNGTKKYAYENVTEDNTILIASIFDRTNNNYTDETAVFRFGGGTDPKTFTVYFGDKTPPPLVKSNITTLTYDPGKLDWNTTYYWKVDVWNNKSEKTEGKIWKFTTRDNNPPNIPSNPFPSNDSINDTICPKNFSWSGGDPNGDNVTYDVYFGRCGEDLILIASNITTTWYQDSHLLEFETCYIWKIVARDEYGFESQGPIWTFTTQENLPPYPPSNPHPDDGEHYVPPTANLNWVGGDPNPCDMVTYDVYFGVTNPPTIKKSNITGNCYDPPGDMEIYRTYYWKVVAWDSEGLRASSPVWNFTTGSPPPPPQPIINGSTYGKVGIEYEYTFYVEDNGCRDVSIFVNWNDGSTNWTSVIAPGTEITLNHTWYEEGTYTIRAKARDIYGLEGEWGTLKVTMPISKIVLFNWWLERFPRLQKILDALRLNIR